MKYGKKKALFNESGFVTADFMFSFLLASMLTSLLFAMCFSFTVIEIAQYISFSATRASIPAHKSYSNQRQRAETKLNKLLTHPELAPLLQNGWFEVTLKDIRLGQNPSDFYENEYDMSPISGSGFVVPAAGVRLNFVAKILNLNLGPLGKIESESGGDFALTVGSMLFREPSQEECTHLIRERYQKLITLDPIYGAVQGQQIQNYVPMEDNGC